jgi:hypothetical protein
MEVRDALSATLTASAWFSWIGVLIALLPSLFAFAIVGEPWTSLFSYDGRSRLRNWSCAIVVPIAFWVPATLLLARLMA